MPRIPDNVLNCVFFVYPPDEGAARTGKPIGGTGFIVSVPSAVPGRDYTYGITNWHLAIDQGKSFVRINRKDGKPPDIFPFDSSDWAAHPDGCDIAAIPLFINSAIHDVSAIPIESFPHEGNAPNLGLGDNVFMAGRFVDHDGGATNVPSVRFGNIAVMPTPMDQGRRRERESYCIDLHSRTGYSGSPVFAYRTPGNDLADAQKTGQLNMLGPYFLLLLGIHWAQFDEWQPVHRNKSDRKAKRTPAAWAEGYSGMTCVVPANRILELLHTPRLKKHREMSDEAMAKLSAERGDKPSVESAGGRPNIETVARNMLGDSSALKRAKRGRAKKD